MGVWVCRRTSLGEPARDASSQGGRAPHISSGGPTPMMPIPLRRRISEGGCPIKISVRRPYPRPSSPPHGTATQHSEVVTVVFPHVIDDLDQAPGQRHPGDLGPFALLHRPEPRSQRTRLPGRLGRGEHQHPAQEAIAFLTDMPAPDPVGTRAHPRGEPDVAGHVFGAREAVDIAQLHDQHDGDEGADAGERHEASHAGILAPALAQVVIQPPDLLIEQGQQSPAVLTDGDGNRRERQGVQLALAAHREPTLATRRLQIAARQHREQPIANLASQPHQAHAMPNEFTGFAERGRRNPYRRQEVSAEQQRQPLGIHAVVLEPRRRDRLRLFGIGQHRAMPGALEQIHQPPPRARGLDGHGRPWGQLREERFQPRRVVGESPLSDLALLGQHRDLRHAFVQVNPNMYHRLGLLSQRGLPPSLRSQPSPGWAGGQRTYDIKILKRRETRRPSCGASFIGFTGTPIELQDANTRAVFGDYISVYDIQRAVQDGATVPIYYESRLAKLALDETEKPRIDPEFEEVTEGEEVERKEKLKTKWAQLEAVVGAEKRLKLIARDIVEHFERRLEAMDGKAMIVCMSRRICVELYREIMRLRPHWHDEEDGQGRIKVVMTGSASDPADWQPHIRNKPRREALAKRFRDPNDRFGIAIVRDMWLTGFDAPSLHTMYVDKPMRSHGLMQAIARVNRVFRDKPGGLVVDYLGLAHELKQALATYTESGGTGTTALDQGEAVALMLEKYEICGGLLHGFDWSRWVSGAPAERLSLLPPAQEHILKQKNGKERFLPAVRELSQAFALAVPHEEAMRIRDDVAFFQAVRSVLAKRAPGDARP